MYEEGYFPIEFCIPRALMFSKEGECHPGIRVTVKISKLTVHHFETSRASTLTNDQWFSFNYPCHIAIVDPFSEPCSNQVLRGNTAHFHQSCKYYCFHSFRT